MLSRLDHAACTLPVYASQPRSLADHATLGSAAVASLSAGRFLFSCGVSLQGFGYVICIFLLAQALPGAHHVHLLVEATDAPSLGSGMRAHGIRIALRVNRLLMRSGAVIADRWHGRELTSPRAVRHAIVYVLANFRKHGPARPARVDPYSSAPYFEGFREFSGSAAVVVNASIIPRALAPPLLAPVSRPQTWLLATGWKRRGLISIAEAPAT